MALPNKFFRMAAQETTPMPQMPGNNLGLMLAADFINQNPRLKRAFEQHMARLLVPQSAGRPARQDVTKSVVDLLAAGSPR